ncbi:hypothetical protein SAMN06296386_102388 [Lachnospiraceae bacterium]|nr:hypothetical protein SAMN06296386_102388 [Lachnospiraceae bacterium]
MRMKMREKFLRIALGTVMTAVIVSGGLTGNTRAYAEVEHGSSPGVLIKTPNDSSDSGSSGSQDSGSSDSGSSSDSSGQYGSATSTNPYIVPAATWVTPVATHGEALYVVLPLVNMFEYNVHNVIVTPELSTSTDEFPFEIDATGFTQKIDTLVGEKEQPDRNKRVQNCVWTFRTRDNVKSGYYKLSYQVTYTDPLNEVQTCTISTYVKTVGLPKYGTTDGYEKDSKLSTPRVIVTGFKTEPAEVQAGEKFLLTLTMKNTSKRTAVDNMELDLTGIVAGKDEASSYAAFLPTSGANSFYVNSIPAGGETELSMEFTAKADLEQKPYVMDIKMNYEDDEANPYEGEANVSIPVHQPARFDTSSPTVEPSSINVGEQSDVMFSIYNTGKTKLYNVTVSMNDPSIDPCLAFVGAIDSGNTGNVDVMVTGVAPTEGDGTIPCVISYEDEAGNVTQTTKEINLFVTEYMEEDYGFEGEEEEQEGMNPTVRNLIIAAAGIIALIVFLVVFFKIRKKRKKAKEEAELRELAEETAEDEKNDNH